MSKVSMPSSAVVMNVAAGFWLSRALRAAARLRVADHPSASSSPPARKD